MSIKKSAFIALLAVLLASPFSSALSATTSMRVLYPSFGGTWAVPWIAKEASYFMAEFRRRKSSTSWIGFGAATPTR